MKIEIKSQENTDLSNYQDILKSVFELRMDAKRFKELAAAKEEEANGLFAGVREILGIEAVESNIGTIRYVTRESSSFKKDVLKDYLIKKGVDSDLVKKGFEKATEKKTVSSVNFYPADK